MHRMNSWLKVRKITALAAVLVAIGASTAWALASYVSTESETGARSGNVAQISDTSGSAGSMVKFGTSPTASCPAAKRVITSTDVSNLTNSGYPAGTQVFVPDGPDPWGGCFPGPDTTGIPDGTVLTAYSGPCNITTPNTTITAKNITCGLTINAANVTIENSKITTSNIDVASGSLMFRDNEVDFGNDINGEGLRGENFTVLRSNMYGGKRQVWCLDTCTLQDSYLHDQLSDPTGVTHESAARVQENTTYRHNTLNCNAPNFPPDAGCSANQTGYPDFAPIHDNTLERNFYMATTGGYCSYGGATGTKPYSNDPLNATNIRSIENVFQRGTAANDRTSIALTDKRRYTCGYYGVTVDYNSSKAGFEFTGNMWDDGLLFANDSTYPYGGFYF